MELIKRPHDEEERQGYEKELCACMGLLLELYEVADSVQKDIDWLMRKSMRKPEGDNEYKRKRYHKMTKDMRAYLRSWQDNMLGHTGQNMDNFIEDADWLYDLLRLIADRTADKSTAQRIRAIIFNFPSRGLFKFN